MLDRPRTIARQHFHQVAGQPTAGARCAQAQQVNRRAAAVGVHQFAAHQRPVLIARRLPGVDRCLSGEQPELSLPVTQGVRVAAVDFDRGEQGLAAVLAQPLMQASGETAEVRILAITQAEYGVVQALEARGVAQHLAFETASAVRCLAVAEGADHEQRVIRFTQILRADIRQRLHLHRQPGGLQLPGGLPRQLFGKPALAGETDQPSGRVAGRWLEAFACVLNLFFLAPTVQVQQPAGDEKQRHAHCSEGDDDPSDEAEIAADVQCVNAGQQLRLETLVGVAVDPVDHAGGRVEGDLVQRAIMRRAVEQVEHGRRLPGHGRHADVVGGQARAGGAVDAAPHRRVVGGRSRACRCRTATTAHAFVLRRVGQQFGQAFVVPLVGPGQSGKRQQQIHQQTPGAGYRVQVPIEAAALFLPVEGQPHSPAVPLPWPAQIQPGEAEEQQDQGARAGDVAPGVAHGEEAVQLQHQAEEVLAHGIAHELAGVRVEVAHFATAFAFGRGEVDACGVAAVGLDPEHRDLFAGRRFNVLHQFDRRQDAGDLFFHLQHRRIQRPQDFVLERIGGTGNAHQGQHQPGSDAKKPVQLEQGFLQHVTRRPFENCFHGAHYAVGDRELL